MCSFGKTSYLLVFLHSFVELDALPVVEQAFALVLEHALLVVDLLALLLVVEQALLLVVEQALALTFLFVLQLPFPHLLLEAEVLLDSFIHFSFLFISNIIVCKKRQNIHV